MSRTRRDVLRYAVPAALGASAVGPVGAFRELAGMLPVPRLLAATDELAGAAGSADEVAGAEALWQPVAESFGQSDVVYLNSAGVGPAAARVTDEYLRLLRASNLAPSQTLWSELAPRRDDVRRRLAEFLGCDAEEVALTRGASEALEICQLGLDLRPGDEVLATGHEYPRMLDTFRQRERRDGIVLRTVPVPVPLQDPPAFVAAVAEGITSRTRLILASQMVNLTGQLLPVAAICGLARSRGVPVLVDGAQALGHVPGGPREWGADFYGASLHKWLGAPAGTGVLVVRRERIGDLWPLMPAPQASRDDIRKFEQVGTQPLAGLLAVGDALAVHAAIGTERKAARLRYLRDLWVAPLRGEERVRFLTNRDPALSCGIATFQIAGIDSDALARWLWERHRIVVQAISHPGDPALHGIRVAAGLDVLPEDLARLTTALESALQRGLA